MTGDQCQVEVENAALTDKGGILQLLKLIGKGGRAGVAHADISSKKKFRGKNISNFKSDLKTVGDFYII